MRTNSSVSSRGIEGRDTSGTSGTLFRNGTLGGQFQREVTSEIHFLEDLVFTDERGDHLADLLAFQQLAYYRRLLDQLQSLLHCSVAQPTETNAGHSSIVGDDSQILDVRTVTDGINQRSRDTSETETTDEKGRRTLHILDRFLSGRA